MIFTERITELKEKKKWQYFTQTTVETIIIVSSIKDIYITWFDENNTSAIFSHLYNCI